MKLQDLVTASPAKSRQRKWVVHERICPNSVRHTDRIVMKDPLHGSTKPRNIPDDASRCGTEAELFGVAISDNAVAVLRRAVGRFGAPATTLSDNGSCFVGSKAQKAVLILGSDPV